MKAVTHSEALFLIDHDWNDAFRALKEYMLTKKSPVDIETVHNGISLGIWCRLQCKLFEVERLPESRQKELEAIGFDFGMINTAREKTNSTGATEEERAKMWKESFECLLRFVETYKRLPFWDDIFEDRKIGSWLNGQRARFEKLSLDKRELIRDYISQDTKTEVKWKTHYQALVEYMEIHGRRPDYKAEFKGLPVGEWLSNQRSIYNKRELLPARQDALMKIGALG